MLNFNRLIQKASKVAQATFTELADINGISYPILSITNDMNEMGIAIVREHVVTMSINNIPVNYKELKDKTIVTRKGAGVINDFYKSGEFFIIVYSLNQS